MVAKDKKSVGLGKSLIRNRFKTNQNARLKVNPDGSVVKHTTELEDGTASWTKMQSITQENDLEAFLTTATLAGTEFTAEKLNIQVVAKGYQNPFLLTADEEAETIEKHHEFKSHLTVPRRPVWDGVASPDEQQRKERESFLDWRRGLVVLEEEKGLLMTPYERNIEVWRQLWRVIERSDIIVQIVDARNPLLFRSTDLESYVQEVDSRKKNLLLVNKADMLTASQREKWADYFESVGVSYLFFSAALAKKKIAEELAREVEEVLEAERIEKEERVREEMRRLAMEGSVAALRGTKARSNQLSMMMSVDDFEDNGDEVGTDDMEQVEQAGESMAVEESAADQEMEGEEGSEGEEDEQDDDDEDYEETEEEDDDDQVHELTEDMSYGIYASTAWKKGRADDEEPERIRILSVDELLDRLSKECPTPLRENEKKVTVGFVGYPNVGKSSTLNALVGAKKVTVSATPGKTKHFQTIHLDDSTILCDCPGLVFPSFATTKAEMVVNGVLPIDQLREHTAPATLVAKRIPRHALQRIYGIRIRTFDIEGNFDPNVAVTGEDLCQAYAVARGFKKAGQGNPDEARAARIILKDYVSGKLLFCHPPSEDIDPIEFNAETYSGDEFKPKAPKIQTHEVAGEGGDSDDDDDDMASEYDRTVRVGSSGVSPAEEALLQRSIDSNFFRGSASIPGVKTKGKFAQGDGFTRAKLYPHQVGASATAGTGTGEVGGKGKAGKGKGKGKEVVKPVKTALPAMGFGLEEAKSKKHKKEKRGKVRVNWTADERGD
ncbi:hypothetical protein HDU76_002979 [Blyttiomyces sp. JEL0837]|nr:hypothetical protein HDU76_002979 [Blyttiomyces sp. JEL0837]